MRPTDPTLAYSARWSAFFAGCARAHLRRNFHALRVASDGAAPELDRPTILYCNHPSWWDPLVLLVLFRAVFPEHRVLGPIDAAALERYSILRRVGLFPIAAGTLAGARAFLEGGERVLAERGLALALTAQGAFSDARARPVRLRPGVAHLLAADPVRQAIPVALEYVFWNERAPEILVRFGAAVRCDEIGSGSSVVAARARLEAALESTQDRLARDAQGRDPGRFDIVLAGRGGGVGGPYDWFERFRAWIRREPFDPSHSSIGR